MALNDLPNQGRVGLRPDVQCWHNYDLTTNNMTRIWCPGLFHQNLQNIFFSHWLLICDCWKGKGKSQNVIE